MWNWSHQTVSIFKRSMLANPLRRNEGKRRKLADTIRVRCITGPFDYKRAAGAARSGPASDTSKKFAQTGPQFAECAPYPSAICI